MARILQYDRNVLLNSLSSQLGVNPEIAKSKAKLIADSYNSARTYTETDKEATETIIKSSKAAFGFEINQSILETALKYVGKYEGNIASEDFIKIERAKNQTEKLEQAIYQYNKNTRRAYENDKKFVKQLHPKVYKTNGIDAGFFSHHERGAAPLPSAQTLKKIGKYGGISLLVAALGFGGYFGYKKYGSSVKEKAIAYTASGVQIEQSLDSKYQAQFNAQKIEVEKFKKDLEERISKLEKDFEEKRVALTQAAQAQAVKAPTAAPAPQHLFYDADSNPVEMPIWRYDQRTAEHDVFQCDKEAAKNASKYSQRIWKWFGFLRGTKSKPLEVKYERQGNDYSANVNPQISARVESLDNLSKVAVTFTLGDRTITYIGLKPNATSRLKVPKEYFNAQARITIQRLYSRSDGKVFDVSASTDSTKRITYKPKCEEKKISAPTQPEKPKVEEPEIGIPWHEDHFKVPTSTKQ